MQKENESSIWSPDDFMFKQFAMHLSIMRFPERKDYFVLSSGINEFPMPTIWKELISFEIQHDFAYQWYTSEEGFPALQKAAKLWENITATEGDLYTPALQGNACMTLGASQAAAIVFDFISCYYPCSKVLLVGLNYPLFERLSKPYNLKISEILAEDYNEDSISLLPKVDQVIEHVKGVMPKLLIITIPNNPTGETYTETDLIKIFNIANELNIFVLIDRAGQMPISKKEFINVSKSIIKSDSQEHIIQINSFSKTESVPGLRIGYLLASKKIVTHCVKYQLNTILNPPTMPVLPIYYSFLFRSIFIMEQKRWNQHCNIEDIIKIFVRLFEITTAVAPKGFMCELDKKLSDLQAGADYQDYTKELLYNESCMDRNRNYVLETLRNHKKRVTSLKNGFNFLIELDALKGRDEEDICRRFFEQTRIALLTESCFRLFRSKRNNFWIRISLAAPEDKFRIAIDQLKRFIENLR